MIARVLALLSLLPYWLIAKSYLLSPVPAASNEVLALDPAPCGAACLERHLDHERPFSFLAYYDPKVGNGYLRERYQHFRSLLNVESSFEPDLKVAILVPSKAIGRYAVMVTNAANGYFLSRGAPFEVAVFDSLTEEEEALSKTLEEIKAGGFRYIIAPVTPAGAERLAKLNRHFQIFIPTVFRGEVRRQGDNLIYGGIDYKGQLFALSGFEQGQKLLVFSEPTALSNRLTKLADETSMLPPIRVELRRHHVRFDNLFEKEKVDINTTALLNTQPVKTSLILSQLTYHDINVSTILSTQMNYSPLVLTLTQEQDTAKFLVASSIGPTERNVEEANAVLGNNIRFNWITYSTVVLSDLIYQRHDGDFEGKSKMFGMELFNNQVRYPVRIYRIEKKKYVEAKPPETVEPPEDNATETNPEAPPAFP